MAGTYPDVPGPRLPYDRDGTQVYIYVASNGTSTQQGQSVIDDLNDEDSGGTIGFFPAGQYVIFVFPQPMDIVGYAVSWHSELGGGLQQSGGIDYSTDTTNFQDGTWTAMTNPPNTAEPIGLRTNIQTTNITNVKAIRMQGTGGVWMSRPSVVHFYGTPTSSTGDRLVFWHPTLDQPLSQTPAFFDYGDVTRDAVDIVRDFRLKNISASLTANTITVGSEAFTDASPTYISQTQFRYNGGGYASTASLPSLAAGTISQTFSVKFDISASAALGLWTQRYYAQAASWS